MMCVRLAAILEKLFGLDLQGFSQSTQGAHGRVSRTPFQIADVAALHPNFERQLLLRHAFQLPAAPNVRTEELNHIHCRTWPQRRALVCIPIVSFSLALSASSGNQPYLKGG